ncbi:hypothetical protein [Pseudomaricurvus hydrocarbonicus]|uniref:hypothetical protein n=1 Tax=Pseudomaricurvus hydrocarbonicus TaxID=1470433 RepID=UPI00141FA2A8|nr:hypothetical protein [Aestuariicella hydrocarbonica]
MRQIITKPQPERLIFQLADVDVFSVHKVLLEQVLDRHFPPPRLSELGAYLRHLFLKNKELSILIEGEETFRSTETNR